MKYLYPVTCPVAGWSVHVKLDGDIVRSLRKKSHVSQLTPSQLDAAELAIRRELAMQNGCDHEHAAGTPINLEKLVYGAPIS